jgi:hypothetical protein
VNNLILLCDQVIRDEATKKYTLVGLFNRFFSTAFPMILKPFFIFSQLTDVDELEHTLSIVNGDEILFSGTFTGHVDHPLTNQPDLNMVAMIPGLRIDHEGIYEVRLSSKEKKLASVNLIVDFPEEPRMKELTSQDIDKIIKDPQLIRKAIGEFSCRKCGTKARYGICIDPYTALDESVKSFPANLVHHCENCETREWLGIMKSKLVEKLGQNQS